MARFCLMPRQANAFKDAIRKGEVDIYELRDMSSKQRREFFAKYFGENDAKRVNVEYEKRLVLKNYEKAMVNWAKKLTGISVEKKRDLQNRIQNMIKRGELTSDNADRMLTDLVEYRLGGTVSESEANKIFELSQKAESLKNFTNDKERIEYGKAVYDLHQYAIDISTKTPKSTKKYLQQAALEAMSVPRSLMASMDLSALFNQGLLLSTSKEFYQSALGLNGRQAIWKQFKSQEAYELTMADIITRKNYDLAKQSGLRLTSMSNKLTEREETFISTVAEEKIPGISKLIKGSDRAYSGFLNQLRMDAYDRLINDAALNGEDVRPGSQAAIEAANIVNNFTGAGSWFNKKKVNPIWNMLLFSPRRTMSIINNVNPITYVTLQSNTVRKYALARLFSFAGVVLMLAGFAKMSPDDELDFETDIRSSNFGKLKIGDRWIDITGGHMRFLNALWTGVIGGVYTGFGGEDKLLFGKKNSFTGTINPTGDGEYDTRASKEIISYIRNKLAPIPSYLFGLYTHEDYKGDKFQPGKEFARMFIPMSMGDMLDWNDGTLTGLQAIAGTLLNVFGFNSFVSTNIPDWHNKDTKEMVQLREQLSEKELTEAEKLYGKLYTERLNELAKTKEYQKLDNDDKRDKISDLKTEVKKAVFNRYNFTPKKAKKSS